MKSNNTDKLYTALHRLGRQLHRSAHRLGHMEGKYREQSRLLLLIAENDGIIQRDLAEMMDVRPSSMTEMLSKMEQLGLVVRKPDENDQRVMHIFLTEQGKHTAENSKQAHEKLTEKMFESLTEEEIDELIRLTEKLTIHLNAMDSTEQEASHSHHRGFGHHGLGGKHCHDRLPHHLDFDDRRFK